MDIFAFAMIGLGLAMDAAAVSMCKGLAVCQVKPKHCFIAGAYFGIFQGVMPAIGYALGRTFSTLIDTYAYWVSFALLVLVGTSPSSSPLWRCGWAARWATVTVPSPSAWAASSSSSSGLKSCWRVCTYCNNH